LPKTPFAAGPLAFGEGGVQERVEKETDNCAAEVFYGGAENVCRDEIGKAREGRS
jgi:hypothetical protein